MLLLKNEVKRVELILAAISGRSGELAHNDGVCHSVHRGLLCCGAVMPHLHPNVSCSSSCRLTTPLALTTWSGCWPPASVSHILNLQLRLYHRKHSDLLQQDLLNQQRGGRIWAALHISW